MHRTYNVTELNESILLSVPCCNKLFCHSIEGTSVSSPPCEFFFINLKMSYLACSVLGHHCMLVLEQ
uniref:Uncharacterized protein n=1 Tax=Arundo donax TaxID=35708 RepID=A0A0A8YJ89_ARUDO